MRTLCRLLLAGLLLAPDARAVEVVAVPDLGSVEGLTPRAPVPGFVPAFTPIAGLESLPLEEALRQTALESGVLEQTAQAPRQEAISETQTVAQASVLTGLEQTVRPTETAAQAQSLESRVDVLFHEDVARSGGASEPIAAPSVETRQAPALKRVEKRERSLGKAPRPRALSRQRGFARLAPIALVAALVLLLPAVALAAPQAAGPVAITAQTALSWLAGVHPLATAGGAILGAAYGLIASRGKEDASAGEVLAKVMSYGVLGGAGAYALLDLAQLVFVGPSLGLKPLSAAVATAAFGKAAFPTKFADANTTSADRVFGAFPAVAASLGLSIGVSLVAPAFSYQLAMGAMAATGVATAVYAAVFRPGRSPADGPALMGKGYVLQALMSGLALALGSQLSWVFAALAAAGFLTVLFAFGRELWSLRPKPQR